MIRKINMYTVINILQIHYLCLTSSPLNRYIYIYTYIPVFMNHDSPSKVCSAWCPIKIFLSLCLSYFICVKRFWMYCPLRQFFRFKVEVKVNIFVKIHLLITTLWRTHQTILQIKIKHWYCKFQLKNLLIQERD